MTSKARFHPEAVADLDNAIGFYWQQSRSAAQRFVGSYATAIARIEENPETWGSYIAGTRRILITGFPYFVVYMPCDGVPIIIDVAHAKRRPLYWADRLEES